MAAAAAPRYRRALHGSRRTASGSALRPGNILRVLFLLLWLAFLLWPLYWTAVMSIKPVSDYQTIPPVWFPAHPTIIHYTAALHTYRGLHGLENSVIVAVFTTLVSVIVGTAAAYSIARYRTGGNHIAFWVLSQRFLPPVAVIIPIFLLVRNLGLYDTQLALVLVYTVFTLPLSTWMMYAYFRQMPVELEEAGLVDGCSRWQVLWKIAWPLAAPGIIAAGAFAFIFSWTEFFFALILTSQNAVTLPALFTQFQGFQGAQYGEASALTIVSLGPAVLLGLLVQRHLVRGLTLGALQG